MLFIYLSWLVSCTGGNLPFGRESSPGVVPLVRAISHPLVPSCPHVPLEPWLQLLGESRVSPISSPSPSERCWWETCTLVSPRWRSAHLRYMKTQVPPRLALFFKKGKRNLVAGGSSIWVTGAGPCSRSWGHGCSAAGRCRDPGAPPARGTQRPGQEKPFPKSLSGLNRPFDPPWRIKAYFLVAGCLATREKQTKRAKKELIIFWCAPSDKP